MKRKTPKVTIGLPVYNGEEQIMATIESLLDFEFDDFELIISDNASTDTTAEICRMAAAKDSRISFRPKKINMGITRNFNRLPQIAEGRYFMWAACGDRWDRRFLGSCVSALDNDEGAVLCYCNAKLVDKHYNQLDLYRDPFLIESSNPVERVQTLMSKLGMCNAVLGLIRTDTLRSSVLFKDGMHSQDNLLLADLAIQGKFIQLDEALFTRVRESPKDMSQEENIRAFIRRKARLDRVYLGDTSDSSIRLSYIRLAVRHLELFRKSSLSNEEKQELINSVVRIWDTRYKGEMQFELDRFIKLTLAGQFNRKWSDDLTDKVPAPLPQVLEYLWAAELLQDLTEAQIMIPDFPGLHLARTKLLAHLGRMEEAKAAWKIEHASRPDQPGCRELGSALGLL